MVVRSVDCWPYCNYGEDVVRKRSSVFVSEIDTGWR